jgi:hypothetical protein
MNKVAQAEPDAVYFGGIIENNAAQLIKDKVGAGDAQRRGPLRRTDGNFVDELLGQAGDAANGIYVTFGGLPRASSPPRARSSSRPTRASTTTRSSPTPPTPTRRPT